MCKKEIHQKAKNQTAESDDKLISLKLKQVSAATSSV